MAFHRWHTFIDSWTGCSKHGKNPIFSYVLIFLKYVDCQGQIVDSPGLKFGPGFGVRCLMFVDQNSQAFSVDFENM